MIVPATLADADSVVALWERCGLVRPWNDPRQDFVRAVSFAGSDILLLRDGDVLNGSVMVGFDGHRGWIYYLAVAAGERRLGRGRMMMDAATAWLRDIGAPKMQLMVRGGNADALAFYEILGLERQDVVTLGRFLEGE